MLDLSTQIDASEWLKKGNILIHPNEGVWGIGCDALNKKSVSRVYQLKKRPLDKSFIILCNNINTLNKFLMPLSKEELNFIDEMDQEPVTFLYKYNPEHTPNHLKNKSGKLAIRVSTHYHINALLKTFNKPITSTSANISGKKISSNIDEIIKEFDFEDVAFYNKPLGHLNKPTPIIDLHTKEIIRP